VLKMACTPFEPSARLELMFAGKLMILSKTILSDFESFIKVVVLDAYMNLGF